MVQWRCGGRRSSSVVALARPAPEHSFTRDYVCVHEHPQGSGSCIDRLHLRPRSAALPFPPFPCQAASRIVHRALQALLVDIYTKNARTPASHRPESRGFTVRRGSIQQFQTNNLVCSESTCVRGTSRLCPI